MPPSKDQPTLKRERSSPDLSAAAQAHASISDALVTPPTTNLSVPITVPTGVPPGQTRASLSTSKPPTKQPRLVGGLSSARGDNTSPRQFSSDTIAPSPPPSHDPVVSRNLVDAASDSLAGMTPPNVEVPDSVYSNLKRFFGYSPPRYKGTSNATGPPSTRQFSSYDMHLHSDLQLKNLVVCKDLASNICQDGIKKLEETFDSEGLRNQDVKHYPDLQHDSLARSSSRTQGLRDENGLLVAMTSPPLSDRDIATAAVSQPNAFDMPLLRQAPSGHATTPAPLEPRKIFDHAADVASVIISRDLSATGKKSIFAVEQVSKSESKDAIPDARALVIPREEIRSDKTAQLLNIVYSPMRAIHGQFLVQIEFKNLTVGEKGLMDRIVKKPLRRWEYCTSCAAVKANPGQAPPPGSPKCKASDPSHRVLFHFGCANPSFDARSDIRSIWIPDASHDTSLIVFQCSSSESASDLAKFEDHVRQQLWAQLVKMDSTFGLIVSGNYVIVGHRERATCTLTLSEVIKIESLEVCYGGLFTSVILAAYQDVLDRCSRPSA